VEIKRAVMKKDWKYILYVAIAIGIFVLVKLTSPKKYDWTVTLAHDDKDPYGTYALHQLLPAVVGGSEVRTSYQTLYELKDSLSESNNIFILARRFSAGKEDVQTLLNHVHKGGNAFISAQYFWGSLADTLNIDTRDEFFTHERFGMRDSAYLQFVSTYIDTTQRFWFRRDNIHNYFHKFDTTKTTVITKNDFNHPVTIKISFGKGNIILNTTPLVFTNIYLLARDNDQLISKTLSYLPPDNNFLWTEYYQRGRMEAATPLRFILTNEPLKWAYYITIFSILLFMLFEAKRKQRPIPVIRPFANTTLEFVRTIGNLYFQAGDHKNAAEKKIQFLFEQIRSKYYLSTTTLDENFVRLLTVKSGKPERQVDDLIETIGIITSARNISEDQLIELNRKIEDFNN
jgi:hypothetical protein